MVSKAFLNVIFSSLKVAHLDDILHKSHEYETHELGIKSSEISSWVTLINDIFIDANDVLLFVMDSCV